MQLPFNTRMIAREIQSCTNASKMPPTFDIKKYIVCNISQNCAVEI